MLLVVIFYVFKLKGRYEVFREIKGLYSKEFFLLVFRLYFEKENLLFIILMLFFSVNMCVRYLC